MREHTSASPLTPKLCLLLTVMRDMSGPAVPVRSVPVRAVPVRAVSSPAVPVRAVPAQAVSNPVVPVRAVAESGVVFRLPAEHGRPNPAAEVLLHGDHVSADSVSL